MFEDATFETMGTIHTRSRNWMIATFGLNASILAALIAIPLFYPSALPQMVSAILMEAPAPVEEAASDFVDEGDVYTLHKNPVFIATKAIYMSLRQKWVLAAAEPARVPPSLSLALLGALHRGEEQAVQAIHALDFGDYAMAVSLFKRALSALNESFSLLNADDAEPHPAVARYRDFAAPALFDLREIWLRVTSECREELERPADEES